MPLTTHAPSVTPPDPPPKTFSTRYKLWTRLSGEFELGDDGAYSVLLEVLSLLEDAGHTEAIDSVHMLRFR
jgi:hypothetical protein